ncbi:hypothetical protein NGR_c23890 [Sinorhizobium fredii NGR234]|uniref:Uncharacterized protein n=1 Tax=Sinorhizobium fredii (strain NBRC 101917 / NGR234) TaxID=394 RepID=C3MG75_SINFN|nr:hypothetical protein NGR_c23890 [Sinorhizobium fredii NGR234]
MHAVVAGHASFRYASLRTTRDDGVQPKNRRKKVQGTGGRGMPLRPPAGRRCRQADAGQNRNATMQLLPQHFIVAPGHAPVE